MQKTEHTIEKRILNYFGGKPIEIDELKKLLNLKVDRIDFQKSCSLKADK